MKSKAWYIKFPMDAYALVPIRFEEEVGVEQVRAYARKFEGCKRLPENFECWTTND
jgi:hypothetical protein